MYLLDNNVTLNNVVKCQNGMKRVYTLISSSITMDGHGGTSLLTLRCVPMIDFEQNNLITCLKCDTL